MKEKIQKIVILILCISILLTVVINLDGITDTITKLALRQPDIIIPEGNDYYLNREFAFVKPPESYIPYSYNDLLNVLYSIIDHGWTQFTFYCPKEYSTCLNDAKEISKDKELLTHLNNFVHPFNSASNMITTLRDNGEVHMVVEYLYTNEDIAKINTKVDNIIKRIITPSMDTREKILAIHDYIINNSRYDLIMSSSKSSTHHSNIAYGPLFEGYATCNGYTDLMAIFLEKLDILNYKIAKTPIIEMKFEGHVWNAVYIDNEWLHLDLTWDDPVSRDGKDYLQHNYFLINDEELQELDNPKGIIDHQYPTDVYIEFKE